jgi:hypothetical protein
MLFYKFIHIVKNESVEKGKIWVLTEKGNVFHGNG